MLCFTCNNFKRVVCINLGRRNKMNYKYFLAWVLVLFIEIIKLYSIIHSPYGPMDVLFCLTLIVVSLIIGITALFYFRKDN